MTTEEVEVRLNSLQEELRALKQQPADESTQAGSGRASQLLNFALTHWPLLSFLVAMLIAAYVYFAFNVDYFDEYRSLATTRKLAAFYVEQGNSYLLGFRFAAAADAYKNAIELDKNNATAAYGLAKARVMLPPNEGGSLSAEEVATGLDFLEQQFPDDYIVHVMRSHMLENGGNFAKAKDALLRAIELNRSCAECYVNLGYFAQVEQNLKEAKEHYESALKLKPQSYMANNNLGFLTMLEGDFEQAREYFTRSEERAPSLITSYNIADAYALSGDFRTAAYRRANALTHAERVSASSDYMAGRWHYNYLPIKRGDTETITYRVFLISREEKMAFGYLGLAIDHALLGNLKEAKAAIDIAQKLDPSGAYKTYFRYRILTAKGFLNLKQTSLDALDEISAMLK